MGQKSQNPKIFITGPYSRVGSRLVELAERRGFALAGFEKIRARARIVDITDRSQVKRFVQDEMPDWIVHTAAMTDVDGCETKPELARRINVAGSENVAESCREIGSKLIHISTDYVFDGRHGPYDEKDEPNPINVYGLTKLESERKIHSICPSALTVRICVPFDWNVDASPNFLMWLVNRLRAGTQVKIVTDQWNSPTYVPHLCGTLLSLGQAEAEGIYHVSGRETLSRHEFALKICRVFGLEENLIRPCLSSEFKQPARRPSRAGLKVESVEKRIEAKMLTVEEGLEHCRV